MVSALTEWIISKNLEPEKNIADEYIQAIQENQARLETINQTIKKYNQSLLYCQQGSEDLAVIQLKKVLSLNPNLVKAHQLLALLYIKTGEYERAGRELRRRWPSTGPIIPPCIIRRSWRLWSESPQAADKKPRDKKRVREIRVKIRTLSPIPAAMRPLSCRQDIKRIQALMWC